MMEDGDVDSYMLENTMEQKLIKAECSISLLNPKVERLAEEWGWMHKAIDTTTYFRYYLIESQIFHQISNTVA